MPLIKPLCISRDFKDASHVSLSNCTLAFNTGDILAGGIHNTSGSSILVAANSVIWGNTDPTGTGESAQITNDEGVVYTLDTELDLIEGSTKDELEQAMEGHILDQTELIGLYERE